MGFPVTDVKTAIEFIPLDERRRVPEMSLAATVPPEMPVAAPPHKKVSLRSEWALVIFSQVLAWLAGYMAATAAGGVGRYALVFGVMGVAALAVTVAHLGKVNRAWRAVSNWRRSWLSREVILSSVFVALGCAWLGMAQGREVLGWAVAGVGFAALFSIDRVYSVTRTPGLGGHSGGALLNGVFAAGLLAWHGPLIVLIGAVKLLAYGMRKHRFHTEGKNARVGTSVFRIIVGIVLPVGAWIASPEEGLLWAVVAAAACDTIDRCEYYEEMNVVTPRGQMIADLERYVDRAHKTAAIPIGPR